MMSKFLVLAAVALSSYQAFAGDAAVNVEHGDGHVDNTLTHGGGHGLAEMARLNHDKIHTGHALSEQEYETEFGDWHHNDVGLGQHENLFHEVVNDDEDDDDDDDEHDHFEHGFEHGHH